MLDIILKGASFEGLEPLTERAVRSASRLNGDMSFGDVSVNFRYLADTLSVDMGLCERLLTDFFQRNRYVERVESASVFVNLFLRRDKMAEELLARYSANGIGGRTLAGRTALVEHTSATPIAPPHIGRIHNTVIGDATVRLLRFLGAEVSAHYFVNDMAKQIAITVTACGGAEGIDFHNMLEAFRSASERLATDAELEKSVRERLNKLESGDADTVKEFRRIVSECIEGHKRIFADMRIYFDSFDYESKYITDGSVDRIVSDLKERGRISVSPDGAVSVILDTEKDGERVLFPLTRENGTSLYSLRDICYSIDKARRGADINVVVLGEEQIPHYKKVSEVLKVLGYRNADCVSYAHLDSSVTVYSTKQGRGMITEDVADGIAESLSLAYGHRMDGASIRAMAYGIIKFELLRWDNRHNAVFDADKLCSGGGGDCGATVYACVRAGSLIRKYEETIKRGTDPSYEVYQSDESVWELLRECCRFPSVLDSTVKSGYQFSKLCLYLIALSKKFSSLYERVRIIDGAYADRRDAVILLVRLVRDILKDGLGILGIDVPKEM